jgi:hypothetical protein
MAQQQSFKISVQRQIVSAHIDSDNNNKKIVITTGDKIANVQRFMIRSLYPELDKEYIRSFSITDEGEKAFARFTDDKDAGVFTLPLKDVADKLEKGKTYKLYTQAIPRDPEMAARVKVKRILIATIEVQ